MIWFTLGPPGRPGDFASENSVVGVSDPSSFKQILAYVEGNNLKIDPKAFEDTFKSGQMPVLQQDESVELAFKCGRDTFCITNKRVMVIDIKG